MDISRLKLTESFCPICLDIVQSNIIEKNSKVYLEIICPKHGKFEHLHKWDDQRYYKAMDLIEDDIKRQPAGLLIDTNYDCNQNCNFCFAEVEERKKEAPSLSQIMTRIKDFKGIYINLCGGEPTLRQDLPAIIRKLKENKFIVILSTNGKSLTDRRYVKELKMSGLDIVQLQFDTLDDQQYEFIRNEKLVDIKLRAVENLKQEKIFIYLWVAIIKGVNDNQLTRIINYAAKNSSVIKVVYFVPMWREGKIVEHNSISAEELLELLGKEYNINAQDFIDSAVFDYYTSAIYKQLTKVPFLKYVPCTINCHFLSMDNSIEPLSKLIVLQRVNQQLKIIYQLLREESISEKIRLFLKISYLFLFKEFFLNKKIRPFTIATLRSIFFFLLNRSVPLNKDNYSFQVRIEAFFDRFNTDFSMLKQCNLYAYFKDELVPLCQREIIRKRPLV